MLQPPLIIGCSSRTRCTLALVTFRSYLERRIMNGGSYKHLLLRSNDHFQPYGGAILSVTLLLLTP